MRRDNNVRKKEYFPLVALSFVAMCNYKPMVRSSSLWSFLDFILNPNLVKIYKSIGYGLYFYFLGLSYIKISNPSVIIDCSI